MSPVLDEVIFTCSLETSPTSEVSTSPNPDGAPAVGMADALRFTVSPGCTPTTEPPVGESGEATPDRVSCALTVVAAAWAGTIARPIAPVAHRAATAPIQVLGELERLRPARSST